MLKSFSQGGVKLNALQQLIYQNGYRDPYNAIYAKPTNKQEEGKTKQRTLKTSFGLSFTSCVFAVLTRKWTLKTSHSVF